MAKPLQVEVYNPNGKYRVISTKSMPGTRWINLLIEQDCRLEICTQKKTILSVEDIISLIGDRCDGVIAQILTTIFEPRNDTIKFRRHHIKQHSEMQPKLTEDWGETLFSALSRAGGKAFSNMAVGYNNVDANAANKYGVAVGNTPGVLTETTAELAASLSLAAARRIVEADEFMRAGLYDGWLPHLYDCPYGQFLKANGEQPVTWKRASSMDEVLREADVEAILINCSRGPVIDEVALVEHLKANPMFRVGLDVFEDEPYMKPGLSEMKNAIVVPHIASASKVIVYFSSTLRVFIQASLITIYVSMNQCVMYAVDSRRNGNIGCIKCLGENKGYPIWGDPNRVEPFLDENSPPPAACPSIVNSKALGNSFTSYDCTPLVDNITRLILECPKKRLCQLVAGLPVSKL
ncbi:hypothetical protein DH2020_045377 [Rehmannia glutinosa]|uniref:Glycerate dehydrogenase n=1 Tax=Rehmannia glutinosa TaxID=99300 RepID=A0ABR0UFE3_REHGL